MAKKQQNLEFFKNGLIKCNFLSGIFFTSAVSFVVLNGLTVVMKAPMKDRCREKNNAHSMHISMYIVLNGNNNHDCLNKNSSAKSMTEERLQKTRV